MVMKKVFATVVSWFKYVLAVFMMQAGVMTMFIPARPNTNLDIIYDSRLTLVIFGIIYFGSGLGLFLGKVRKDCKMVGNSLFAIYNCFLFSAILNWVGLGFSFAWINLICAAFVGCLYLRWKYGLWYYDPVAKCRRPKKVSRY